VTFIHFTLSPPVLSFPTSLCLPSSSRAFLRQRYRDKNGGNKSVKRAAAGLHGIRLIQSRRSAKSIRHHFITRKM
jgi:hypothetical protein